MKTEEQEYGDDGHEAGIEPENHTDEREEQEEIEGCDSLGVPDKGEQGEAPVASQDDMFEIWREKTTITVIEDDITPLEEEEEQGRPCPGDTHETKACCGNAAEEEWKEIHDIMWESLKDRRS